MPLLRLRLRSAAGALSRAFAAAEVSGPPWAKPGHLPELPGASGPGTGETARVRCRDRCFSDGEVELLAVQFVGHWRRWRQRLQTWMVSSIAIDPQPGYHPRGSVCRRRVRDVGIVAREALVREISA